MIAALFLAIQLFGQSQSEVCEGDFPNATEVMTLLKRTYMLRSLEDSPNVQCAYQIFYNYREHGKYDKVVLPRGAKTHPQQSPLYVKRVVNSTIYLDTKADFDMQPTFLDILYSNLTSCMVTKGPYKENFPQGCRLWLTNSSFANPEPRCIEGFKRHCNLTPFSSYNITGCVDLNAPLK
uniref:Putative secreted protein n=1 Tax=Ixodes ricinus TaxID=34613 RepID=A0A090XD10_IXORI